MSESTERSGTKPRRCYKDGNPVPRFGDAILDHEIEEYRTWVEALRSDGGE
jgi:hypothetical protein